MPKLTFAGQVDQPANLRLERAEPTERQLIQEALDEPDNGEVFHSADVLIASLDAPSPPALREGDLVMCNPAGTQKWLPGKVTKIGDKYVHAEYAPKKVSAWDSDHWRPPTPTELAEHAPKEDGWREWKVGDGRPHATLGFTSVQVRCKYMDGEQAEFASDPANNVWHGNTAIIAYLVLQ